MNLREYEKLTPDNKLALTAQIVSTAMTYLLTGDSVTLLHRKLQVELKHSRNLVEYVLRTHEGFKKLVKNRWDHNMKYKRIHSWVA